MELSVPALTEWWRYDNLEHRAPYDWSPAVRGKHPWDQLDFHLDLGCGRLRKGRLGIDHKPSPGSVDLIMDLDRLHVDLDRISDDKLNELSHTPRQSYGSSPGHLPFPANSIRSIISHHALEHIGPGFERLMEECYRVLEVGGVMRIIVPLFPSYAAVSEYDHKRYFMEKTMMGFCQEPHGGPSMTDGFAERYNSCCFRMVDEIISPATDPGKVWTPEDTRELRTTLWKHAGDETEPPNPRAYLPEGAIYDQGEIHARSKNGVRDQASGGEAASAGGAGESTGNGDGSPDSAIDPLEEKADLCSSGVGVGSAALGVGFASVCVLSYNRLHLLKECIGSILAHAEADFELIVHDDGSTDPELREWLVRMSDEGVISTLLMNSPGWNEGQGIAMNRMAAVAKGDPIIKCDQDLLFKPGWLRKVNEILVENDRKIAHPEQEWVEPLIGALGLFRYPAEPVRYEDMFIQDWVTFEECKDFVGSCIVIPRVAWELFGPWTERSAAFAEDNLFKLEIAKEENWCCALTKEELAVNQGFGIGPSTVVVAEGTVQEIKQEPRVYRPQGV
jgi:SAM-dependent methyltransferase